MAINQLFKVATEFKFEVGAALLGASNLEGQVNKLSGAADNALISFQKMGLGIAANLGIGSGGVIGLFQKAIQSSEKFRDSQLKLSTVFAANRDKFIGPVDDFNSRLQVSGVILKNIAAQAKKFSLPEQQLASQSALLFAQLSSKGLAGTNGENAVNIGRDFLKASPVLGVNPGQAQNQLLSLIEGSATGNNTLFRRLSGETDAFKDFVGNAKKFNQLKAAERVKKLTEGLQQFTSQADEVNARTELIGNRLQVLGSVFAGFDGIIKPLGDAAAPLLSKFIGDVTKVVDTDLRRVFLSLTETFKILVPDVESLTVNLLQLKEAANDTGKAVRTLGILGLIGIAAKFAFLARFLVPMVGLLGRVVGFFGGLFTKIGGFGLILRTLGFIVSKLFIPFAVLLGIFQTISRARAIAKVADLKALPKIFAQFSELGNRFIKAISNIFSPFTDIINFIAEAISPLFQFSFFLQFLIGPLESIVSLFESFGTAVILARASFEGLVLAILQFVDNVKGGKFLSLTDNVKEAFNFGIENFLEKNASRLDSGESAISNSVTNIGKVEIKNEFRENLEPDRIAFSLQKQLLKTAQSPTQARGRNFSRGASTTALGGN